MNDATLYDQDIEGWAEVQVAALRRLATVSGPWSNVIDWENVIEEIEDLGSERRRSVESLLGLVFVHLLKVGAQPHALTAHHWRAEVDNFLSLARSKGRKSIRARLDLDEIWRASLRDAERKLRPYDQTLPADLPQSCPFTFEQLVLDPGFDPLAHRLSASLLGNDR